MVLGKPLSSETSNAWAAAMAHSSTHEKGPLQALTVTEGRLERGQEPGSLGSETDQEGELERGPCLAPST